MKWATLLVLAAAGMSGGVAESLAEENTFFKSVRFVQYLDENTALEEVRNGNIDAYYYSIPSSRLEDRQSRQGLQVFGSSGGPYSILVNPAESEEFNPFSSRDVRFALNYLVDRKLIVNEILGGYGHELAAYYGPADPEFLTVIDVVEGFNFRYNPALADEMITAAMLREGAVKNNGVWEADSRPVEITVFIRSDDPLRKSIGELLASELEGMGFAVVREFGDLNKAFVLVYGTDPADLEWSLYTEGWNKAAFARYDSVGLAQMYAPWFSNMPGFNNPEYWNYENGVLDELTQEIYAGGFNSSAHRGQLVRDAVAEGVGESVRVFLASRTNQYVAGSGIAGIVNDFGAGLPSRFTPINAHGGGDEMTIGVKQIYQGSWNPVMGLTDSYSRHIWGIVSDPGVFKHPFTGETIPVRTGWEVETAGPHGRINITHGAETWNPQQQQWEAVPEGSGATSRVTFDFEFGNWHNGIPMDINDIRHSLYFVMEWGTQTGKDDRTFDAEFTPRAAQSISTIKGIRQVDGDTMEVYVDYWHFDDAEIAQWASLWSTMPWEITDAMERMVLDGKSSFSKSGASSKNTGWLSLVVPNDARQIRGYLGMSAEEGRLPAALRGAEDGEGAQRRYEASGRWIAEKDHAVISNGPFYLESYSPEARSMTVRTFADRSYPFPAGSWSGFEHPDLPEIRQVRVQDVAGRGSAMSIYVETSNADRIRYYLTDGRDHRIASGTAEATEGPTAITIGPEATARLSPGANSIRIFATSESVLMPDFYEASFISAAAAGLPDRPDAGAVPRADDGQPPYWIAAAIAAALAAAALLRRSRKRIVPRD